MTTPLRVTGCTRADVLAADSAADGARRPHRGDL